MPFCVSVAINFNPSVSFRVSAASFPLILPTSMHKLVKILLGLISGLFLIYLVGFGIIFSFQDRYIFQRQILDQGHTFSHAAQELNIPSSEGVTLNALLFKSPDTTKGLILYFHGNRHSLERWGRYAADLKGLGYDILMVDYRGYGKSSGIPSETGLYQDAEAVYAWAKKNFPDLPLIYYGRSLGTGVATHLATKYLPEKLVLETPFDELKNVVPIYFRFLLHLLPLRHAFLNKDRLSKITCPILILHGTQDQIVPLSSALNLKPLLKPSDVFVIVPGGRHNNLLRIEEGKKAVTTFLN